MLLLLLLLFLLFLLAARVGLASFIKILEKSRIKAFGACCAASLAHPLLSQSLHSPRLAIATSFASKGGPGDVCTGHWALRSNTPKTRFCLLQLRNKQSTSFNKALTILLPWLF